MDKINFKTNKGFRKTPVIILSFLFICFCLSGQKATASTGEHPGTGEDEVYMFIGSYAAAEDPGLYVYSYEEKNLRLKEIQQISGHPNPSFFALHPSGNFLYVVNETASFRGNEAGSVTSFMVNKKTGELEYLNKKSSRGGNPCQIMVLDDGSHALVANYSGGNISALPIASDGSLKEATEVIQHEGSGPNKRRQEKAHAHSVYESAEGAYVFAADLGTDKVMIYKIQSQDKLLVPNPASPFARLEPGAGPRHLAFHPESRWIYVINELNSTVTRLEFDNESGQVSVLESVTTLPADWEGENYCADIHVHPSGKFLYASNRGHNSIAVFKIKSDGRLIPFIHEPVRGEWPRNFSIDPAGKRLFVANQNSGNIVIFDINQNTGELCFTGKELKVKRPVCIKFYQVN